MNILTAENITKSYGERKLLHNASFFLQEGEKAGIIGINGTGKTTLLRMIAGLEEPDEGTMITANHAVVRYLPQHPHFEQEDTVLEAVLKGSASGSRSGGGIFKDSISHGSVSKANVSKANVLKANVPKDKLALEYDWNLESDAKAMLTRLGVTDFGMKCGHLSGGQKKRLALVSVLLSPAEILILDEPTNHLDNDMADWLEEVLKKRKGSLIMVTHDRYFLDSVSDRIIEIDKGNIYSYAANYSGYLELKAAREEIAQASERKRQSMLKVELEWMLRGAKARATKQKAHIQRYEALRDQSGPAADKTVEMGSVSSRLGKTTVELAHVGKAYGEKVLIEDFSYIFLKNDRIGFIGHNGCGKTTLMKILTGRCEPDTGTVIIGQTVKIGYYAQEIEDTKMQPDKRVIDYVRDTAEYIETEEGKISASKMLERFLFEGEEQYGLIGKLSGGEKRRLSLLRVLMEAPNVLILDEPTNDLDIATLTILEDYLDYFQGIVIVVSHDRYFLDRTVRRIFAFEEGGRLRQYEGGYTDYAIRRRWEEQEAAKAQAREKGGRISGRTDEAASCVGQNQGKEGRSWKEGAVKKLKFTYQEQKDYETIEAEIAALEEKLENVEKEILRFSRDFTKLNELTQEKEKTERILEEKMDRWIYLEDLAARIEKGETAT